MYINHEAHQNDIFSNFTLNYTKRDLRSETSLLIRCPIGGFPSEENKNLGIPCIIRIENSEKK